MIEIDMFGLLYGDFSGDAQNIFSIKFCACYYTFNESFLLRLHIQNLLTTEWKKREQELQKKISKKKSLYWPWFPECNLRQVLILINLRGWLFWEDDYSIRFLQLFFSVLYLFLSRQF